MLENPLVKFSEDKARHAKSLCELGRWREVLDFALSWQKSDPEEHRAAFYAGLGYAGTGQFAQAEKAYRYALQLNARDIKAWNNLGGLLFEHLRRPLDGIHCLEEALKLNPDNKLGWLNLSGMALKLGMPERALDHAQKALSLDPRLIEALLCKGAAAKALRRPDLIQQVCESLSKISPEDYRPARR